MNKKILLFTVIFSCLLASLPFFQYLYPIATIHYPDASAFYLFAHGLGGNQRQAHYYARKQGILAVPLVSFNFPDVKNDSSAIDRNKVNLGQELDIITLKKAYYEAEQQFPNMPCILTGVSRGAATILNFLATDDFPNIAAVIVESPFDHLHTVLAHQLKLLKLEWLPGIHNVCMSFARFWWFPGVDMEGIFPIKSIRKIRKNLPIIFVHSAEDELIPTICSRRLYEELVDAGHKDVYYFELSAGKHAQVITGPQATVYQQVIHAFYKKYNLPHKKKLAAQGKTMLAQCQPVSISTETKLNKNV